MVVAVVRVIKAPMEAMDRVRLEGREHLEVDRVMAELEPVQVDRVETVSPPAVVVVANLDYLELERRVRVLMGG